LALWQLKGRWNKSVTELHNLHGFCTGLVILIHIFLMNPFEMIQLQP